MKAIALGGAWKLYFNNQREKVMSKMLSAMLLLGSTALVPVGLISPSEAATETVLHDFNGQSEPQGPLLKNGNLLYGVTSFGGTSTNSNCNGMGCGVVFQYNVSTGAYKVLYNFCSVANHLNNNCNDGQSPNGGLIMDTSGNLYGTTFLGSYSNAGIVYELVKPTGSGSWTLTVLHNFADLGSDGNGPNAGLTYVGQASGDLYDGTSALYGETEAGGGGGVDNQGYGTIFSLSGTSEQVLVAFNDTSGQYPYGGLSADGSGNLWGTTAEGGSAGYGMAYELKSGFSLPTVIYNFCWNNQTNCPSGELPNGVTLDGTNVLVGTAGGGDANGDGVLYKLYNPGGCSEGGGSFWCISVLHTFTFAQGSNQNGNVLIDSSGNMFGTAFRGGSSHETGGSGTAWELSGSTFSLLHTFCPSGTCADGEDPSGGLINDSSGTLYGAAELGGNGSGVLYDITGAR